MRASFALVVPALAILALSACSSTAAKAPPPPATTGIGPIPVAAGEEKTVCIVKQLGNVDDLVVSQIDATLALGSHHVIVYRSEATDEQLVPTPCQPFLGTFVGEEVPIALMGREKTSVVFPQGVGVVLHAQQMLKIEAHYINATKEDLQGSASVTFTGQRESEAGDYQAADVIFWGTRNISIPPNASWTTGQHFQAGIPGTHLFLVTTHQHQLGTDIQVWSSPKAGMVGPLLTDATNWAEPRYQSVDPMIDFDGTSGLTYECQYQNTTSATVSFGESVNDEMCFAGGYYYPSKGFDLCIDGSCPKR